MALPLLEFLDGDVGGSYDGLDINPRAIAWARENIASNWSNFRFRHIDVRHPVANPSGLLASSEVDFALERNWCDLVMLHSVFTHILTATIENYTRQIAQTLVCGGYLYLTLFEWDEEAEAAYSAGACPWSFDHDLMGVRVVDPDLPTFAVAVESRFLSSVMETNKLRREDEVRGRWRTGFHPLRARF